MTVQAALTSGLLLCGTLYVTHARTRCRGVAVAPTMVLTITLLMVTVRRAHVAQDAASGAYLEGRETRNVLIVGDGRVGQALRNHLESLRHMGFRFRGFISAAARRGSSSRWKTMSLVGHCAELR